MKCKSFEPLVALFVEGDLGDSDRLRVQKHLKNCAGCWDLLCELEESQSTFKALRQGVVNSGALSEVRARVLSDVGGLDPAPAWVVAAHRLLFAGLRRRTAIAGICVGALLLGGVGLRWAHRDAQPVQTSAPPSAIAEVDQPPVNSYTVEEPAFANPVKSIPKPRNRRVEVAEPEQQVAAQTNSIQFPIKFVTDDPNIIIYWLPSDKGD